MPIYNNDAQYPMWVNNGKLMAWNSNTSAYEDSGISSGGGVSLLSPPGIAFLGTSITAPISTGTVPQDVRSESRGWATWFLVALNQPFHTVINKAVGGDTTTMMRARYLADIAANYNRIGVLVFEPGPNDFSTDALLLPEIVSNYEYIISSARAEGIAMIVISPTPSESITALGVPKRDKAKTALSALCKQYDCLYINTDEVLLDPATGIQIPNYYMPLVKEAVRVHLSAIGGAALGNFVAKIVGGTFTKFQLPGGTKRNQNEYMPNPNLTGDNATGTNFFKLGTGGTGAAPTGTGPDTTAVAVTKGGFTSVVCSKGVLSGTELLPIAPMQVVVTGAQSDQSELLIRFGSNMDGTAGTTQQGFWDGNTNWAATTAYVVGHHFQNSLFPGGVWTCVIGGTSGATKPAPVAADNYGEIKVDGGVTWLWQETPVAGQQFIAEIEYEITALTGSINLSAAVLLARSNSTAPELWGQGWLNYFDNTTGDPFAGYPGTTMPKKGVLRSLPITLVNPGVALRYIQLSLFAQFMNASSATIKISGVSVVKVS